MILAGLAQLAEHFSCKEDVVGSNPTPGSLSVRRIVPDLHAADPGASRAFFVDVLGLEMAMDLGWIVTFVCAGPANVQISVMSQDAPAPVRPDVSIEVDDVDAVHDRSSASVTRSCIR